MDFKLVSDDHRKIHLNMDLINIYTGRYKPGTPFDFSCTRRQATDSDPMRRYYFAEIMPKLTNKLGYERDETLFFHQQLKIRHFRNHPKFLDEDGKTIIKQDEWGIWQNVPKVFSKGSTLPISTKQKFVKWVVREAAREGVYIEDPGGE